MTCAITLYPKRHFKTATSWNIIAKVDTILSRLVVFREATCSWKFLVLLCQVVQALQFIGRKQWYLGYTKAIFRGPCHAREYLLYPLDPYPQIHSYQVFLVSTLLILHLTILIMLKMTETFTLPKTTWTFVVFLTQLCEIGTGVTISPI